MRLTSLLIFMVYITIASGATMSIDDQDAFESATLNLRTSLRLGAELINTPDKAIELAQALVAIQHGKDNVRNEAPFVAVDLGDKWKVSGTRPGDAISYFKTITIIFLDKRTGNLIGWTQQGDQAIVPP